MAQADWLAPFLFVGRRSGLAGSGMRGTGAEALLAPNPLRGAEAPPFHGGVCISLFLRCAVVS
jgi:hypothetical protein